MTQSFKEFKNESLPIINEYLKRSLNINCSLIYKGVLKDNDRAHQFYPHIGICISLKLLLGDESEPHLIDQ